MYHKVGHAQYIWDPHFWEGEVIGVSDGITQKSDGGGRPSEVSILTIALSNHSATTCLTLKSTWDGSLSGKI